MSSERPDAIIVGSGAGGGTAARVLTQHGWNVVVLERGPLLRPDDFLPFDELHFLHHKTLIPKITDDPMIYAGLDGISPRPSERWWEVNAVGGSTMIWDANFPRYTPEDFDVTPYVRGVPNSEYMVKWPWSYEEFLPYFERAEHEWGVSGDASQSEEPMRPGYQFAQPPLKPHASTPFLMSLFRRAGLKPYLGPRAISSQTFDGRPGCPFCGYCQSFGCTVNCRANALNTVLRRALDTGRCDLRPEHYVTRIAHDSNGNGRTVRGVWYKTEPDGPEQFLAADRVIVAVQAIQSARLFLYSEIPNPNGLIGRFLTYHTKGEAHFTFPNMKAWDPGLNQAFQPVTAVGSLQLRGLYTYPDADGVRRKAGKFSVYDPFTCVPPIRLVRGAALGAAQRNVWGADLATYLRELRDQAGVHVSFTGDAMSRPENRVELDPKVRDPWGVPVAKTYYRHDAWDLAMSKFALGT